MMPYIVSVIGKSNSGKTTLLEGIIPILNKRVGRLGTIKHDVHGFQIDYPGKDTYRHYQAGAAAVLITDGSRLCFQEKAKQGNSILSIIDRFFKDYDLILIEGYKSLPLPKIEVLRRERGIESICGGDENLRLIVTDCDEKEIIAKNKQIKKGNISFIDLNDHEKTAVFILRERERYVKKKAQRHQGTCLRAGAQHRQAKS